MSASREKVKRRELRADGSEKRQVRAQKSQKAKKREKIIKTIVRIAVIVLIVVFIVFNSNLFYSGLASIRMGNWKLQIPILIISTIIPSIIFIRSIIHTSAIR